MATPYGTLSTMAAAMLLLQLNFACSNAASPQASVAPVLSPHSLYLEASSLFKQGGGANGALTFNELYSGWMEHASNAPFTVAGVEISGVRDELLASAAYYRALDQVYANVATFWSDAHVNMNVVPTEAAFTSALSEAAREFAKAKTSAATARLGLVQVDPNFDMSNIPSSNQLGFQACKPNSNLSILYGKLPVQPTPMQDYISQLESMCGGPGIRIVKDQKGNWGNLNIDKDGRLVDAKLDIQSGDLARSNVSLTPGTNSVGVSVNDVTLLIPAEDTEALSQAEGERQLNGGADQ